MKHSKLEKFEKIDKLGEGTYGVVYKVKDKETEQFYALKKIRLESEQQGIPSTAIREISILKELNHPNIVKLYDVVHSNKKLVLVFEYVEYDLKKFMSKFPKDKGMDPLIVKALCYQLLKGVEVCHSRKILHRDLKPQNLLISSDKILKLADFGLARASAIPVKSYTHEVVTLWYRPPDVLLGSQKYSTQIDIWSVGCIFAEMANMKPLFPGQKQQDELQRIFKVVGTPDPAKWPGVVDLPQWKNYTFQQYQGESLAKIVPRLDQRGIDLLQVGIYIIQKLLKANPAERITACQALKHPYFSDLPQYLTEMYQKLQKS